MGSSILPQPSASPPCLNQRQLSTRWRHPLNGDLVRRGYIVVSIEYLERPDDPPMVNSADLAILRRPVWQVGANGIGFVIEEMARQGFSDPAYGAVLIGHQMVAI